MKVIILAIMGASLYGISAVIIRQELSKLHSLTVIICYFPIVILLSITTQLIIKHFSPSTNMSIPTDLATWKAIAALSIIVFFGGFCYIGALTSEGGNIFVITSLMMLAPIAAAAFQNFWERTTPNPWQIAGYIVAILAIILMTKGNSIQT